MVQPEQQVRPRVYGSSIDCSSIDHRCICHGCCICGVCAAPPPPRSCLACTYQQVHKRRTSPLTHALLLEPAVPILVDYRASSMPACQCTGVHASIQVPWLLSANCLGAAAWLAMWCDVHSYTLQCVYSRLLQFNFRKPSQPQYCQMLRISLMNVHELTHLCERIAMRSNRPLLFSS